MSLEYLSTVDPQFAEAVLSGFGIMFGVICVSCIPIIFFNNRYRYNSIEKTC